MLLGPSVARHDELKVNCRKHGLEQVVLSQWHTVPRSLRGVNEASEKYPRMDGSSWG